MSAIDVLRDEYPGDAAWQRFVDVFRPTWAGFQDENVLSKELGDEEIAIVLTASMGDQAKKWFTQPCGALGRRSPSEVMLSERFGVQIIRTLLMRMPR